MEGILRIEEYKIHTIIGTQSYERDLEQEISLDIEMRIDFTECVQTDSIVDSVDYTAVVQLCRDLVKERRYHLLETLTYEMVHALMDSFSPLWVRVRAKKKKAVPLAKEVSIEIELSKRLS